MIDETGGTPQRERELLDVATQSSWVDGVLLSSQGLRGRDLTGLAPNAPVVLLGERTASTTFDHVGIDNVQAAREAVRHLIDAGCRRIAAMGGSAGVSDATSRLRLKGYRQELRAAALLAEDLYIRTPDYKRASGATAIRSLLSRNDPPDGVFCFGDELALGVLRELHEQGVRAPSHFRVVGFDDIEGAGFATPSLTSIRPDKAKIAEIAVEMLIQRLQTPQAKPRDVRVNYDLIVRESSTLS